MMAPVFTYRWQWWVFIASLAFLFAMPFMPRPDWMSRDILYRGYSYIDTQKARITSELLEQKGDIDILFLGTSATGSAIDTSILRAALRPILGREPVIYVISHPTVGYDYDYVVLRDLLKVRKVRLLFWEIAPMQQHNQPYPWVKYVLDLSEHSNLLKMSPGDMIAYYLQSVLNEPKLLLSPVLDREPGYEEDTLCDRYANDGTCLRGLNFNPITPPALPAPPNIKYSDLIHMRDSGDKILKETEAFKPYDYYFFTRATRLIQRHNIPVYLMDTPKQQEDRDSIKMLVLPEKHPARKIPIFAVTKSHLFANPLAEEGFLIDNTHMPYPSTIYFTRAILPTLADLARIHLLNHDETAPDVAALPPGDNTDETEWPGDLQLPGEMKLPDENDMLELMEAIEKEGV